MSQLYGM